MNFDRNGSNKNLQSYLPENKLIKIYGQAAWELHKPTQESGGF